MGDENNTHMGLFLQIFHQFQNLCLDRNVQCGSWLIGNQKLRMADQTHGDHNTLAHTTGELMRILFHTLFHVIDAHHLHHLHGTLFCVCLGDILIMSSQRLNQLVSDGVYRI